MIFFLAPQTGAFGMEGFLRVDGAALLGDRLRVVTYEELIRRRELPLGSYIFSALDQLSPTETEIVVRCREELARAAPDAVLLNDPTQVLHRYELLQAAFEAGRNTSRVSRASQFLQDHHFPVFLRLERQHTGSLTPLLRTQRELNREILRACFRGFRLRDLLVVEYCDTMDSDGVFRKYGAFVVGDRIIPRSILHNRNWVTKSDQRIVDKQTVREEHEYVTHNQHAQWIRETLSLARVGYGRIDYGIQAGKPQVWEINLNPTIGRRADAPPLSASQDEQRKLRAAVRDLSNIQLLDALERIDSRADPSRVLRISISSTELRRLERERTAMQRYRSQKTLFAHLAGPPAKLVAKALGMLGTVSQKGLSS